MTWFCAIEEAGRRGAVRCRSQCKHCSGRYPAPVPETWPTTFETYCGAYVDYAQPVADAIHVVDIARALSMTCRFGGHVSRFVSVAEHAVWVTNEVIRVGHPELALGALHHDDHEAYLGDIPTPLKRMLGASWMKIQKAIDQALAEKFGVSPDQFEHPVIKRADTTALYREAATIKKSLGVGQHWRQDAPLEPLQGLGLKPADAEALFLRMHEELSS